MIQYFVYAAQLVLFAGAILISILLLKKNREYLGNQLLAVCFSLVGLYAFLLFLYKALNSAGLMQVAIRIGFSALVFAVLFLYLTIEVLVYSSFIFRSKPYKLIIWPALAVIVNGCMIFTDWILVQNDDIKTLDYVDWVFYIFSIYIASMIIYSAISLYWNGIRKSEGKSKRNMIFFLIGLGFMFLGLVTEGVGGVVKGLADLFDLLLFLNLSGGVIFMARSVLAKKRVPSDEIEVSQ